MALNSIAIPADAARDGRARALVPYVASWPLFTLKQPFGSFETGTVFRRAPGSNGAHYLVNAVACQCPDYAEWGHICKHVRAIVMWEAQAAAPKRTPMTDLYRRCARVGCEEICESRLCDDCAAIVERSERMAAARARVVEEWAS